MRIAHLFRQALAGLIVLPLVAGCGDAPPPTAPGSEDVSLAEVGRTASAAATIDVGGIWTWTETGRLNMTEAAAAMFGIAPEGPRTHVTCESGGTLTLVQAGDTFSGSATQSSLCESKGGQVFAPAIFPPALDIVDGRIRGRHLEFLFGAGAIPCPYTATATIEGGAAVALRGTGRCLVPGHPQSPLPVPPPPIAPTKTIEWSAVR